MLDHPPAAGAMVAGDGPGTTFAISQLFLGDTDPCVPSAGQFQCTGAIDKTNGWMQFGYDLDGQTDTATTKNHCKPVDGANPAASRVQVTINTASIDTRNAQRDEHLRSNDFLAMDENPQITFASTGVRPVDESTYEVTGDLTIKGVSNQITIPFTFEGAATDPFGNQRVGFEGSVTINRKDYGITWNATLEAGGVLVSDKVTLEFEVSAIKNA